MINKNKIIDDIQIDCIDAIDRLQYLLKVCNKALEIACNEGDLYWLELHALHDNLSLIDYLKKLAILEIEKNANKEF